MAGDDEAPVVYCPLTVVVGRAGSGKTTYVANTFADHATFITAAALGSFVYLPDEMYVVDDYAWFLDDGGANLKTMLEVSPVVIVVQSLEEFPCDLKGAVCDTCSSRCFRDADLITHHDGFPPEH